MPDPDRGREADLDARLAQPDAELGVFRVHEILFPEEADLFINRTRRGEETTRHEINGVLRFRGEMVPRRECPPSESSHPVGGKTGARIDDEGAEHGARV